jgi:predicted transposase/invertase (TIGR01784 family)
MTAVASLRYGVIFKKAFSVPEIFTAFVEDLLGKKLEVDKIETEKSFASPIGQVNVKFDLFAQDLKNRIVVDIQHKRFLDYYDRFLHYHCVALLEQIAKAENHRLPLTVYTIVVLTSGDKHHKDMTVIDFDPHDLHGNPLGEIPHKVIYLCPKYVSAATPEPLRQWLLAIDDSLDEAVEASRYTRPEIRRIFEIIQKDRVTPQERARMIEESHQEELKQDSFAEGLTEGRKAREREIARAMLQQQMSVAQIALLTGLTAAEVTALQAR